MKNYNEVKQWINELQSLGILSASEANTKLQLIEQMLTENKLSNAVINNNGSKSNSFVGIDMTNKQLDTPLVSIKNFTKQYKGRSLPAVQDVTFNIYPGHFHVFIGANGAGKTTTIKSIIGAYSKHNMKGEILINGLNNNTAQAKQSVGYIPENAVFPKKMTSIEYLTLMAMLAGYTKNDAKAMSDELLQKLNLASFAKKCPESFSSGQKKKMLLAQALIRNPSILIMDEPAANLDPLARDELFTTLVNLQREGKAIFLSSHILDEVGKYATYVTILDGGKMVHDGIVNKHTNLTELYKSYVKVGSVDNKS